MRKGRANIRTDKEILEALRTSKNLEEARWKLDVGRSSIQKYVKQLKEKGLLDCNNKPIP